MTFEEIMNNMLSKVSNDIDKREGSIIYDALAPAAAELAKMYVYLNYLNMVTFADEASGEYLERRCAERGIIRKYATKALRLGEFNIPIALGSRFAIQDVTYVSKTLINNQIILECESSGVIGNMYSGELTPLTHIDGLESAMLTDIIVPGEDVEADESLRRRYFDSLQGEAFGGNVADYKQKTLKIDGVGAVKVYPIWAGRGTVKLAILDSEFNQPSQGLIDTVQNTIDPLQYQGEGKGVAPINHTVTIVGATETLINIDFNITLQDGHTWEDVLPDIQNTIQEYFKELRATWGNEEYIIVRVTWIESRILNVLGVLDIQNTQLNNSTGNLALEKDSIPIFGEVSRA